MFPRKPQPELFSSLASVPEGLRVYAIGDVHGRADLLEQQHALMEADFKANSTPAVHLVYLGDYVDRGPDSRGVLERLTGGISDFVNVTLLLGNHEEMLLRFLEDPSLGPTWRYLGGLETMHSYGLDVGNVLKESGYPGLSQRFNAKLPPHHRALFTRMKLSITIGDYFFCHAGVRPGIPLEQQQQQDLLWIRDKFLTSDDDFGKVVVHGHSPTDQPDFRANRINIDTGAYVTGRLTCLVLEGSSRRLLST